MPTNALHVLLVEDDEDHAELVRASFQEAEPEIALDVVTRGGDAMRFLQNAAPFSDAVSPNLILLDLRLPDMDGLEVLSEIKTGEETRGIPVVILTSSANPADRQGAYERHVNSYLVKPGTIEAFHGLIRDVEVYWGSLNRPLVS